MNIFHKVLELWPGHESGTYGRPNRRGHKNARVVFVVHDTSAQCHALRQGKIIQKQKMQELSSLFTTHRINVMHALIKFHEYIPYS